MPSTLVQTTELRRFPPMQPPPFLGVCSVRVASGWTHTADPTPVSIAQAEGLVNTLCGAHLPRHLAGSTAGADGSAPRLPARRRSPVIAEVSDRGEEGSVGDLRPSWGTKDLPASSELAGRCRVDGRGVTSPRPYMVPSTAAVCPGCDTPALHSRYNRRRSYRTGCCRHRSRTSRALPRGPSRGT